MKSGDFPVSHVSFFLGGGGTVFQRLATSASAGAGAVCPWHLKANRPEYKDINILYLY